MSDLIERLRFSRFPVQTPEMAIDLCAEAADEIERLQHNLLVTEQAKTEFQELCKQRLEEIELLRAELAALRAQEPVTWGIDWGSHGDQACASIIKKHNDGSVELVAIEYATFPNHDAQDAARYRWLRDGGIYSLPYDDHGAGPEFDFNDAAIDAAMKDQK